jgi:hypothetical protein
MRRWRRALGAAALGAVVAGGGAEAGPLVSASLQIQFGGQGAAFPGAGATGTATSDLQATLGSGTAFVGTDVVTVPPSQQPNTPVDRLRVVLTANAAGAFAGATPGSVGGPAGFSGYASLSATTSVPCCIDPFLKVPIRIGKTTAFTVMGAGLGFSIHGAPWTAGQTTLTGVDAGFGGASPTTLYATGANALTPGGAGTLTLVSPGKVLVSTGHRFAVIGTLTLSYVPEPGTLALLGAGALALAALGRRAGSGRAAARPIPLP